MAEKLSAEELEARKDSFVVVGVREK